MFEWEHCPKCEKPSDRVIGALLNTVVSNAYHVCWKCSMRRLIKPGEVWHPAQLPTRLRVK